MSFTIRRVDDSSVSSRWKKKLKLALPLALSGLKKLRSYRFSQTAPMQHDGSLRVQSLKRVWMYLVVAFVILLVIIGGMRLVLRIKEIALGTMTLAAAELPEDENGFINILLLGVGDEDHDGTDLTDSVIVASIDADRTESVFLLSLPRDLYALSTAEMGEGRINSLYRDYKGQLRWEGMEEGEASTEALKELGEEIGRFLGIEMHGTIKVTFSGFVEAVDLLDGVDLVVPEDIDDTQYPGPNYSFQTFSIASGPQHLDGETALKYARSRHTTSDFSRSARQQQLLSALSEKARSLGVVKSTSKATEMLSILSKNIESTFSVRELLGLGVLARSIDTTRINGIQLNDQNGLYGSLIETGGFLYAPPREEFEGASVLLPVSIPEFPVTWKQVRAFMDLVTQNREMLYAPVRISILNAGAPSGAARVLAGELERYGFNIVRIDNYGPRGTADEPQSFVDARSSTEVDSDLLKKSMPWHTSLLSEILNITEKEATPNAFTDETNADLVIVLGEEYFYQPLQDLIGQ